MFKGSIKTMIDWLPCDIFIRVHKSFIVPKKIITVINRNMIVYEDLKVPIGMRFRKALGEIYSR